MNSKEVNISIVEGDDVYKFRQDINPGAVANLWASVIITLPEGQYQMSSSSGAVKVDGHLEFVEFEFPPFDAGEYPFVVVVGDPYEELYRIYGVYTVEAKPKKKTSISKKDAEKEEPNDEE